MGSVEVASILECPVCLDTMVKVTLTLTIFSRMTVHMSRSGSINVAMVTTCVSAAQGIQPSSAVLSAENPTGQTIIPPSPTNISPSMNYSGTSKLET